MAAVSPLEAERPLLFGLCYRMTGSAADAEELVQDTFVRALSRPPVRTDEPLRPWLVRVAVNLSRDHLRRRRHAAYVGPWLPSPLETDNVPDFEAPGTAARYDLVESVSLAFLLALEVLTPKQRAVLVLRDVLDYSVRDTAQALSVSEPDVKTTLLRARRAMASYDKLRVDVLGRPALVAQTRDVLQRFLSALARDDGDALTALLRDDVVAISDGGGEFHAAKVPVRGAAKVVLFYRNLARRRSTTWAEMRMLGGLPAFVATLSAPREGEAVRTVMQLDVDADGKVRGIYTALATRKLQAIHFPAALC